MTQSVEVRRVRVDYKTASGPVTAVRDVSFELASSEFLCILGPSGCGKTTIMNCVAGFIVPSAGEILIGGKSVTARGYDRGVVLQDLTQLFPWRTARGNVEFGLQVRKLPVAERRAKAEEMLGLVELQNFSDAYPHELSGGMQQRVAIARALAYDPAVLLMDEPFAALDAMTRDTMQRQLTGIWSATRKTVIYITHNVSEAVYLGDRVMIMGKDGTVKTNLQNKLSRPRDPLGEEFIEMQREVLGQLIH